MNILRNDPEAKREDYNRVLAAVPSAKAVTKILRRTRNLISSRIHDLKVTVAALDGHILRIDGHFKAPHRILRKNGEEAPGCILAFLGCAGFLLGELQVYNSESGKSYIEGARPIPQRRFLAGAGPPHIIADNPPLLEGKIQSLINSIWGGESSTILAGYPHAPPNLF